MSVEQYNTLAQAIFRQNSEIQTINIVDRPPGREIQFVRDFDNVESGCNGVK
jgi:hypothetical protein